MANTTGKKFGGRKKGTPNKLTATVKQAVLEAFDKVGGVKYLQKVAADDPKTFCTMLAKIIPSEIEAKVGGDLNITVMQYGKRHSAE